MGPLPAGVEGLMISSVEGAPDGDQGSGCSVTFSSNFSYLSQMQWDASAITAVNLSIPYQHAILKHQLRSV